MLHEKKHFLFDIDGTLAVDNELYNGTRELITYIESRGGDVFYITNNSTKSREDYVKKFSKWGIETVVDQFVTASYVTCLYLCEHYQNEKIFVMGTPSLLDEIRSFGLDVTEKVEENVACVVVGFDESLTYEKIKMVCRLLTNPEVAYIGTNPDLCCPTTFGFIPDCGGICSMIDSSVGRSPCYVGKPNEEIVNICLEQVNGKKEDAIVIGDRLYTDIACGIHAGVDTAVVLTGEATIEEIAGSIYKPTFCFSNIYDFYKEIQKS